MSKVNINGVEMEQGILQKTMMRTMVRVVSGAVCVAAAMVLAACEKTETAAQSEPASQRAAQQITEHVQQPLDRARAAQEQILQTDQRIHDADMQAGGASR